MNSELKKEMDIEFKKRRKMHLSVLKMMLMIFGLFWIYQTFVHSQPDFVFINTDKINAFMQKEYGELSHHLSQNERQELWHRMDVALKNAFEKYSQNHDDVAIFNVDAEVYPGCHHAIMVDYIDHSLPKSEDACRKIHQRDVTFEIENQWLKNMQKVS